MITNRRPLQDADGLWWIYRSDDPNMHTPLGPFFTRDYALSQEGYAREVEAPLPPSLAHRQPRRPLRPPYKPPNSETTISYRRAWRPDEPDITDGINYSD